MGHCFFLSYHHVVPNRDLVNTLFSFTTNIPNNSRIPSTTVPMDIEIDTLRGRSTSNSPNSSRESSTHSNMLSVAYVNRVQALANSPAQVDQVKDKKSQGSFLFYMTAKKEENSFINLVLIVEPTHTLHKAASNDITTTHGLELTIILYAINQPIDSQLLL